MRPIFPVRAVVYCAAAAVLLTSIPIAWTAFSTAHGLRYTIDPSGYNDSVRLAPISLMWIPRIAAGPPQENRSTVFVLGLNPANSTGNTSCVRPANVSCAPLVVIRSFDGGKSFQTLGINETQLPGWSVETVLLPNGTLVMASWGPWILVSTDSGATWKVTADMGDASAPTSLARDPVTGTLYAVWARYNVWEVVEGPILMSASHDGGVHWSTPVEILSATPGGLYPEVAAYNDQVVVALSYDVVPKHIATIASHDGGATWPEVTNLSVADVGYQMPSVAVSSQGIFAVSWSQPGGNVVSVSRDNGWTWGSSREGSSRSALAASQSGTLGSRTSTGSCSNGSMPCRESKLPAPREPGRSGTRLETPGLSNSRVSRTERPAKCVWSPSRPTRIR